MVAPKKRGAKAGPASKKTAVTAAVEVEPAESVLEESQTSEAELTETEGNNANNENEGSNADNGNAGNNESMDVTTETSTEKAAADASQEEKPAEPVVEKIEPGKLLIENLPSSLLFNYKEHLTELFSKYGEITAVKRGSISVTELTTTPTLSAIVEFKNKDSLEKALSENGTVIEKCKISVTVEPTVHDATAIISVPNEASNEYVHLLFSECGEIIRIKDHNRGKYKSLMVIFASPECLEKAQKLDRELRINGFVVTVTKYRPEEGSNRTNQSSSNNRSNANTSPQRTGGSFRGGRPGGGNSFNSSPNYRGGRGGGARGGFGGGRGGGMFPGGYNTAWGVGGGYMGGYMNDGQRPNKRMRQM